MARLLRILRRLDSAMRRWRRALLPAELVAFEDVTAAWLASALGTAVQLDLASRVPSKGSIALSALAQETQVRQDDLARLVSVIQAHGYFALVQDRVSHTNLSRSLEYGSAGAFCALQSSAWYRDCFCPERVVKSLQEAETPFEFEARERFFETFAQAPERGRLFSLAMSEITRFCGPHLVGHFDFFLGERVLDVGGGDGTLSRLLRSAHPKAEFSTLDLEESEDSDRIQGDFFREIPPGFDHLLLKNVLHDWDDERSIQILENCRKSGARQLTLVELILPASGECCKKGAADYLVDWNVFCTLGGQERTLEDYSCLLEGSGWRLTDARSTGLPLWVLRVESVFG